MRYTVIALMLGDFLIDIFLCFQEREKNYVSMIKTLKRAEELEQKRMVKLYFDAVLSCKLVIECCRLRMQRGMESSNRRRVH